GPSPVRWSARPRSPVCDDGIGWRGSSPPSSWWALPRFACPLLDVPLDRDEGEYAYVARLLLDGIPPFAEAHNMKMPGIYAVYSVLLTVFGSTHTAIHLGLLFANALSIALVFLLGRRLMDATAGVAAAATYALLTLSETVLGSAANAEHFVVPLALSALVLLDSARERSHLTRLLL